MKKSKEKKILKNSGITLIALVITVIVLLILAGVTVATLTGDNGLLQKASTSKQTSKEAEIKEKIMLAVTSANMKNYSSIDKEILDNELIKEFGEGNYELLLVGEGFLISVNKIEYFVEKDAKVSDGNKVEESNIEYAGDLSKGGQYNGDTEDTAYRITCIEDLLEWSNNYNNYKNKNIKLEKTIDFNSTASYNNPRAKITDINENGKIEELITELTTEKGFKPIESFSGVFYGSNNKIQNLYIQKRDYAALIKSSSKEIKNLGIIGKLHSNLISAGIASRANGKILNCYFEGLIISEQESGGIIGQSYGGVSIYNCYNSAEIISYGKEDRSDYIIPDAGGIIATARSVRIINCFNLGNITAQKRAAGICSSDSNAVTVINSFNKGIIKSEENNARSYFI